MTLNLIFSSLNVKILEFVDYTKIYIYNTSDSSFTGTVLSCDIEHNLNMHYLKIKSPTRRFVSIPITSSYYTMGFLHFNLWEERLDEIIEGLITGGIINWYVEKYTKSKWNEMSMESSQKVVLNLSHLGFGFQICFYALYVSFLVFLVELAVGFYGNSSRSLKDDSMPKLYIELALMVVNVVATTIVPRIFDDSTDIDGKNLEISINLKPQSNDVEDKAEYSLDLEEIFGEKVGLILEDLEDIDGQNLQLETL